MLCTIGPDSTMEAKEAKGAAGKKRRIFSKLKKNLLLQLIEKERTVIELRQNTAKILKDNKGRLGSYCD